MEEKQQLEEQMRAVMDKYKYKRRQIRELQEDLQTMSNTLDNLSRDEDAYSETVNEKKVKDTILFSDKLSKHLLWSLTFPCASVCVFSHTSFICDEDF